MLDQSNWTRKNINSKIALLAACLAAPAISFAAPELDGKGIVEDKKAELKSVELKIEKIAGQFSGLDSNNDGVLTLDEVKITPKLEQAFTRLDADKDQKLTETEFHAFKNDVEPKS